MEIQSVTSSEFYVDQSQGQPADIMAALHREIKTFDSRERMVADFKVRRILKMKLLQCLLFFTDL